MTTSAFDAAFETVKGLAADFDANKDYFLSTDYTEAAARKDFIDKFLIALGWDVNHDTQKNPYEQEVKVERAEGGSQRRADYAFYLDPNFHDVSFFVEAKKPSSDLRDKDSIFQTVRYGWNSGTPLSALTNFDGFYVLDCRRKPDIGDTMSRVLARFSRDDYTDAEKFAKIYWLFSHEAVSNRSLAKYVEGLPPPKATRYRRALFKAGQQSMDDVFLEELDGYRGKLARTFKEQNPRLTSAALTELTQRTLDRLVFTRFLEDKLIEPSPHVANFGKGDNAWEDFIAASLKLDRTYNGIVYKRHEILDAPGFLPDDYTFRRVCEGLGDSTSPYNFNHIPIHILGSIYERFLGNVISDAGRLTEKPEVRKAGGVYYTPEYIVRYIVENTVGKLIADKTPKQIAGMRFADIACGSGSFLLGVYDTLLRYHARYYNESPAAARPGDCVRRDDGTLHLTLAKKREILVNNIYGVDLDAQAVEVCQLSLYLKLLEEETTASARQFLLDFEHRTQMKQLLPDLSRNIVRGNSLIGTDISKTQKLTPAEETSLCPMDFEQRFPEIMKRGGFDAIVGNPPYVRIQGFPRNQVKYLTGHYRSATGNCDLYVSFVERSYELLRQEGRFGYIVPNKFFRTDYGEGLREFVASRKALTRVINFGAHQVFGATTYTCLLFLSKRRNETFRYAESEASPAALASLRLATKSTESLNKDSWVFAGEGTTVLLNKLAVKTKRLLDLPADMSRGSSTGNDEAFVVERTANLEEDILRVPVFATDFNRYTFSPATQWRVIFPYDVNQDVPHLFTEQVLKKRFPRAYAYLKSKQAELKKRKQYTEWFGFSAPRNLSLHDRAQIAVPLLADRGLFALIPEETRGSLCPMASGGFTITLATKCPLRPEYVLGLLNSRLLFWRLRQMSNIFRGGWITCTKQYFGELPIAVPSKPRHDEMVRLVEEMLTAKKQSAKALMDTDRDFWANKCADLDDKIDRLVYDLYGLTEDEIKIVQDAAK